MHRTMKSSSRTKCLSNHDGQTFSGIKRRLTTYFPLKEDLRVCALIPEVLWLERRDKGDNGDLGVNFTDLPGFPSGP